MVITSVPEALRRQCRGILEKMTARDLRLVQFTRCHSHDSGTTSE